MVTAFIFMTSTTLLILQPLLQLLSMEMRGELLICVSLGHLLGLDQTPLGETKRSTYDRLLVARWDGHRFVFPADEVRGIHRFQTPEVTEPPATLLVPTAVPHDVIGIL
jgi:chemotaxis-related protein WspD